MQVNVAPGMARLQREFKPALLTFFFERISIRSDVPLRALVHQVLMLPYAELLHNSFRGRLTMRAFHSAIVMAALALFPAITAHAQVPVHVLDGEPTCDACAIQRYRLAVVNDSGYPGGAITTSALVTRVSDGTFFVHAGAGPMTELFRADATGRISERVGTSGEGPGEYRMPWYVNEVDSAYLVHDVGLGRMTWLAKDDLRVLGTARMPFTLSDAPELLDGDRYVVNDMETSSSTPTMRIVSRTGTTAAAFDPAGQYGRRIFTTVGDTLIITANPRIYRVMAFDTTGAAIRVLERTVSWFPPGESGPLQPGEPRLIQFHEEDGLLWVMIGSPTRPVARGPEDIGPFWDKSDSWVVVEVIDLARFEVLASAKIEGYFSSPVRGGFYDAFSRLNHRGEHVLDIWGYRLVRRPERPRTQRLSEARR